jgi:hypothetical protein
MSDDFKYDSFVGHCRKDLGVVRDFAGRPIKTSGQGTHEF